jgi:hypothetical protein
MRKQRNAAKPKKRKWGARTGTGKKKRKLYTPRTKQLAAVQLFVSGSKYAEISRKLGLDRETVVRIVTQEEVHAMVEGFREAVLKMVPNALVALARLIDIGDRTAVIECLYGARVLIDRHEIAPEAEEPVRTYDSTRVLFFGKFGRWPRDEELKAFDKTIPTKPIVKGEFTN